MLTVAAAASLQPAFEELAHEFENETGISVSLSTASTTVLYRQAQEGAPFDLFAAADAEHIQYLVNEGIIDPSFATTFAHGSLVLWQRDDAEPVMLDLEDLTKAEWQHARIGIAKPEYAPYGKAAMETLRNMGIADDFQHNLVFANNVGQAFQYANTGNVSAAFVSASLVPEDTGRAAYVSAGHHEPIVHSLGILSRSNNKVIAGRLRDFILGEAGQRILQRHGFQSPGD